MKNETLAGGFFAGFGLKPSTLAALTGAIIALVIVTSLLPRSNQVAESAAPTQKTAINHEMAVLDACKLLLKGKFPRATHSTFSRGVSTLPSGNVVAIIDAELPRLVDFTWRCDWDKKTDQVKGYVTQ